MHHKLIYIKRTNVIQLGSRFICNCNIALHVSDAIFPSSGALRNCSSSIWWVRRGVLYTVWLSVDAIDLGPCWIPHPGSCHSPEAASTVSKCSWRWTQKASETCRAILQLQINILPSWITLVLFIYILYISLLPRRLGPEHVFPGATSLTGFLPLA